MSLAQDILNWTSHQQDFLKETNKAAENHGEFESSKIEIEFECSHGVWATGGCSSLCYTTNEELSKWIVGQLKVAANAKIYLNALTSAVKTIKNINEMQAMKGYDSFTDNRISDGITEATKSFLGEVSNLLSP